MFAQEIVVSNIYISGNTQTKRAIIERELPFKKGDTLSKDSFERLILIAHNQLVSLNLFNQVKLNFDYQGDAVVVDIGLIEKWYVWPIPALEFADRNFNQWWEFNFNKSRVNYGFYNFIYNVGGLNHTLKLSLISGYTKNIGFEYRVPYVDKKKQVGIGAGSSFKTNHEMVYQTLNNKQQFYHNSDTMVNQRIISFVEFNYRPGLFYYHKLFGTVLNQKIHPSISTLNPGYANGENTLQHLQLGYQFLFRKVDNRFYPTNGTIFSMSPSFNWVKTNSSRGWSELNINAEHYRKLTEFINVGVGASSKISTARKMIYPLNIALGYKQFVRGYETYVMDGQQFILFKSTIRYALFNQKLLNTPWLPLKSYKQSLCSSYLTFFVDGGYVNGSREFNNLNNTALIGAGLGWDWVFYYDKVIRFEYSINKNNQHGLFIHFTKPL